MLQHLDSKNDESYVKAEMYVDNNQISIKRHLDDRSKALFGDENLDRLETLEKLAGYTDGGQDRRTEKIVNLFRASHFFNQQLSSILPNFFKDSEFDDDVLSRMLALQDYIEGIGKSTKVQDVLKKQTKENKTKIEFLKSSLITKKNEILNLQKSISIIEKPDSLQKMGESILNNILSQTDIEIDKQNEFNQETIKFWRSKLDIKINELKLRLENISKLGQEHSNHLTHKEIVVRKSTELEEKNNFLNGIKKQYHEKLEEAEKNKTHHKEVLVKQKALLEEQGITQWLCTAFSEYNQLKEIVIDKENEKKEKIGTLNELTVNFQKGQLEQNKIEENYIKVNGEHEELKKHLKEYIEFKKLQIEKDNLTKRKIDIENIFKKVELDLLDNNRKSKKINDELDSFLIEHNKLQDNIKELQNSQDELKTLLDKIENYIVSNTCPTCGKPHESREKLIQALSLQRGGQPEDLKTKLELLKISDTKLKDITEKKKSFDDFTNKHEQEKRSLQNQILEISLTIEGIENKIELLNTIKESRNTINIQENKTNEITDKVEQGNKVCLEEENNLRNIKEKLLTLKNQISDHTNEINSLEVLQNHNKSLMNKIESEALSKQISLQITLEEIREKDNTLISLIDNSKSRIKDIELIISNDEKECTNLARKKKFHTAEVKGISDQIISINENIEKFASLLKTTGFKQDTNEADIKTTKSELVDHIDKVETLKENIIDFEVAMDSMQTSAILVKTSKEIEDIECQIKEEANKKTDLKEWLAYFKKISSELDSRKTRTIEEYIEKYGHLTSSIQKRLRTAYGFSDIELIPSKSGIKVRVSRKGQKGYMPTDYFSESQIQITLLSLFLSSALTQTWSSFAPILLDDPVTHFDDLNVYSLIDFIRGITFNFQNNKQVFVSTCDNRFLQLMKQKFSTTKCKTIFYKFESIGNDGPKIVKM